MYHENSHAEERSDYTYGFLNFGAWAGQISIAELSDIERLSPSELDAMARVLDPSNPATTEGEQRLAMVEYLLDGGSIALLRS